jgi:replicative DNA helicase
MSRSQIAQKILSTESRVPADKVRRGDIEPHEYDDIADTLALLQDLPIFIDETGALSIAALAARARRLKRQEGLGLIIVDYVQLMTASGKKKTDNRVQEVTEITTGLKALAKELNVPIIACAQLSRQVEQRDDKRPQLSDLRESGSIEQDADIVLFIYREEYYVKGKEPSPDSEEHIKWQTEMEAVHGRAEVIIAKQRHGPTGKIDLHYDGPLTKFGDLERGNYSNFGD